MKGVEGGEEISKAGVHGRKSTFKHSGRMGGGRRYAIARARRMSPDDRQATIFCPLRYEVGPVSVNRTGTQRPEAGIGVVLPRRFVVECKCGPCHSVGIARR